MRINIWTKDGTLIRNCNLYPEDVQYGGIPLSSKGEIEKALSRVPWGRKFIAFQTDNINGHIHVNNIDKYCFVETE